MADTFSFGVRLGLVFIVQSASLSALSVTALLGYVLYNAIRNVYRPPPIGHVQWHFLRTPVDHYFLLLLICDLIQAIGAIMNIKWVHQAILTTGSFCTAQGVIKQVGDVGVALASAAIAVHTFLVLFMRYQISPSRLIPLAVVGAICLFLFLVPLISSLTNTNPPYYGPSTYWCWIDPNYNSQRIGLEYGIMWFVAVLSLLLYIPLFLFLRGNIQVDFERQDTASRGKMKTSWKRIHRDNAWRSDQGGEKESLVVARQMLAYPLIYIILILPMSLVRFIEPGRQLPSEWTAFAGFVFSSSGLVNVFLYVLTRPSLLPSRKSWRRRGGRRRRNADAESAGGSLEDGRTGAMPEMTMLSIVPSISGEPASVLGHVSSPRQGGSAVIVPPTGGLVMLADDDDTSDDDPYELSPGVPSPTSPTNGNGTFGTGRNDGLGVEPAQLSVPLATYRNSWGSDGSKHASGSHSHEGNSFNGVQQNAKLGYK